MKHAKLIAIRIEEARFGRGMSVAALAAALAAPHQRNVKGEEDGSDEEETQSEEKESLDE